MDRQTLERWLLLADSGELSPRRRRQLDRVLAAGPAEARRAAELRRLLAASRAALSADAATAPAVPVRELAGRMETGAGARRIRFAAWAPRLAAAAALFLVCALGVWRIGREPARAGDSVGQLQTLVAVVSEHGFDAAHDAKTAEHERIRELAQHLLLMEGFARDAVSEEQAAWPEGSPTTLQRRSTAAWPPERCG